MTTTLFFRGTADRTTPDRFSLATNAANLAGTAIGWNEPKPLGTTRSSGVTPASVTTVTGPTSGLEISAGSDWISPPIDAGVIISGTTTFNLWMGESATAANAGAQCVIERIDKTGAIVSTITNSEKGVELPKTSAIAAQNWTATPTSTNMLKGDRIRIRVACNDAGGTMVSANTVTFDYGGTTGAADGDSFVTFNETFGFLTTDPTTTPIYPTTSASDADPGGGTVDTYEAWTTRGSGSTNAVTNTVAGWTVPIQVTTSAGGNFIEWFTKPLTAFTLAAPVLANVHGLRTGVGNLAVRAEVAVCATDGTSPTVWGGTTYPVVPLTTDTTQQFYVAGDDVAVSAGQRLRLRFYIDDLPNAAMTTGITMTLTYAGTSGGAAGDTFLTFGQTLTEYTAAATGTPILVMAPPGPA
jgi:hypothetical protein